MTKDDALKMALNALEAATRYGAGGFDDAKDAIKQALELNPLLPDVLTQEYGDSAQYVEGWNECREATIKRLKAELKARGNT